MQALRAHRRLTSWLAALVMMLVSLAPTLSHALVAVTGGDWVEICTAQGAKWVQTGDADAERTPASTAHALEHCPLCSLHTPALGLPPPASSALLPMLLAHERPLAFFSAARTLHAWVTAQPRAPPLFS